MLKIRYLLKKKIAKIWWLHPQTLQILPTPIVLLQNVLILSPIKGQFWLAKFGAILVSSLFVILSLHFTWSRDGTGRIHSLGKRMDVLGMQDFEFAQSDSILSYKCAFLSMKMRLKLKLPGLQPDPIGELSALSLSQTPLAEGVIFMRVLYSLWTVLHKCYSLKNFTW